MVNGGKRISDYLTILYQLYLPGSGQHSKWLEISLAFHAVFQCRPSPSAPINHKEQMLYTKKQPLGFNLIKNVGDVFRKPEHNETDLFDSVNNM